MSKKTKVQKLKSAFILLMFIWTLVVLIKATYDLWRPSVNYYGLFFAVPITLLVIAIGNGVLLALYWVCKRIAVRLVRMN